MLASDVQTRVKEIVGDTAQAQVTNAMVLRWISDCRRDLETRIEYNERQSIAQELSLSEYYLGITDGLIFIRIKTAEWKYTEEDNRVKLRPTSLQAISEMGVVSGTPRYYALAREPVGVGTWDQGPAITIYPYPTSSGLGSVFVTIIGVNSADITVDATDLSDTIPIQFQNLVITYCLMRAKQLDEDWRAAQMFQSEYDTAVNEAAAIWRSGSDSYMTIREDPYDVMDYVPPGVWY